MLKMGKTFEWSFVNVMIFMQMVEKHSDLEADYKNTQFVTWFMGNESMLSRQLMPRLAKTVRFLCNVTVFLKWSNLIDFGQYLYLWHMDMIVSLSLSEHHYRFGTWYAKRMMHDNVWIDKISCICTTESHRIETNVLTKSQKSW